MQKKTTQKYDPILDSIADGVFTVDKQWNITSFNRAAEQITGVSRSEAIGESAGKYFMQMFAEQIVFLKRQ